MASLLPPNPTGANMYPTLSPLNQSYPGLPPRQPVENRRLFEAMDANILDDDFQECWWAQEQDGAEVYVLSWATKQVDRAIIYTIGGGVWAGAIVDYNTLQPRLAEEARARREAGQLTLSKRVEVTQRGAAQYLR